MNVNEIMRSLAEYMRIADETAAIIDGLKDQLKAAMQAAGTDTIIGAEHKASYKTVVSSRIDTAALKGDKVVFGATVLLMDEDTEVEQTYQIVGQYEADLEHGLISIQSPLARALIGKSVGDSVEVASPKGGKSYEILNVEYV